MSLIENALDLAKKQRESRMQHEGSRPELPTGTYSSEALRAHVPTVPSLPPLDFSKLPQIELHGQTLQENRVLANDSRGHIAESAYRMLRTRVVRTMRTSNWSTLGIVAPGPGDGKTLTSVNLAISIAAEVGQQAVLVDLDLRRPTVNKYLGIRPGDFADLSDYLEGRVDDVGKLLISPGIPRLACVMNSRPLERSSDLLSSARGHLLIEELKRRCPGALIVFDLPPLLATDDALVVAPMVDALLFVVAEKGTKRDQVTSARQLVQEFNVLGTLLNKSVEQDTRAYYY